MYYKYPILPYNVLRDRYTPRIFKQKWVARRTRHIFPTNSVAYCEQVGVEVVDPWKIFTPAFEIEPFEKPVEPVTHKQPLCYILKDAFRPIEHLKQIQILTNTIAFNTLPDLIQPVQTSEEEEQMLQQDIIYSHLLDARQEKLPKIEENTEFVMTKKTKLRYGIPMDHRLRSLTYKILSLMARKQRVQDNRHILEQTYSSVTLNHGDLLFHLKIAVGALLTSQRPLPPIMGKEEVVQQSKQELPDIYPLSPFVCIGGRQLDEYPPLLDGCGLRGKTGVFPHTIFTHNTSVFFKDIPEQASGLALLHGFATAAAFAKNNQGATGDLERPVTINCVYTDGRYFQLGMFQLNTLDLTGPTKNFFWSVPWIKLFHDCCFIAADARLDGFNPEVYRLLKCFYAMNS